MPVSFTTSNVDIPQFRHALAVCNVFNFSDSPYDDVHVSESVRHSE